MAEGRYRDFAPLEKLPADWPNAAAAFLSPMSNLNIAAKSAGVVMAPVDAQEQLSLGVDGLWRFVEAEVDAAVPAGAAQTYDIVATTTANVFRPPTHEGEGENDETNYAFALRVVTHGTLPSGGGIAAAQKVGEVDWDGAKIIGIRQSVGTIRSTDPLTPTQPLVSVSALSVVGIAGATAAVAKLASPEGGNVLLELIQGSTAKVRFLANGSIEWVGGPSLERSGSELIVGGKLQVTETAALVGGGTSVTTAEGDSTTKIATTAFVHGVVGTVATALSADVVTIDAELALKAPLASPALTGVPTAPTAAAGTSTTQLATTAFVAQAITPLAPIGGLAYYSGFADPSATWLLANGRALSRSTYAGLLAATTIVRNGTLTHLSKEVTIVTTSLVVGWKVEGTGIPANTTITAIGAGKITLSNEATLTGEEALTFFPWGNGNETTTFNLPLVPAGVFPIGLGASFGMGQRGGAETVALTTNQLAMHNHGVTDPGHVHTPTDPGHVHGVSDPGHDHSVNAWTNNNPAGGGNIGNAWTVGVGFTNPSFDGVNTGIAGGSLTGVTVQSDTTGITIQSHTTGLTVNNAGAGEAHPNMPPWVGLNVIVRVL
jgi:microcystin-dependent protein